MSSTRKRQKELKALRRDAERLWSQQQELWGQAGVVARRASHHAGDYAQNDLAPELRKQYHRHVEPRVERTKEYGAEWRKGVGDAADKARSLQHDVATDPRVKKARKKAGKAASSAKGTAKDLAKDPRVKKATATAKAASKKAQKKAAKATGHSGPGVGGTIGLVLGGVALIGIVYAVWQTFRADDELWVSDDETTPTA